MTVVAIGSVAAVAAVAMLVQWAFNLDNGRVFNVPRRAESARFDVVAQAPDEDPAPGQMQLMMRALLAERFWLIVHVETRDLTAYTLVTDAGGPKIPRS